MGTIAFDLILGCKSMEELGIILNFQQRVITIDEVQLPMRDIRSLSKSKMKALAISNMLAKDPEPKSTEEATQRVVHILDAKYEKADL